jgi:hypothetical protein
MKGRTFWSVTQCHLERAWCFRGTDCLHLQGEEVRKEINQQKQVASSALQPWRLKIFCHDLCVTIDGVLITYTQHSKLQVLTMLSLISTIHRSPQHLLNLFQSAVSSSAIPWQRPLTVEILQLYMLRFYFQSLPCRIQLLTLNWAKFQTSPITSQHGPHRKPCSFSHANHFHGNMFTELFPSNGRLFLTFKLGIPRHPRRGFKYPVRVRRYVVDRNVPPRMEAN